MIFKDHHSKPKYTLPKYPRSQNLTPLSPLTIKQLNNFIGRFSRRFLPRLSIFSTKNKSQNILFHVIEVSVRGISLYRSPQKNRAIQRFRGVKCYFSKKASFLEASHLMSFHFIQIPSNKALLYDILCLRKWTYWKQLN